MGYNSTVKSVLALAILTTTFATAAAEDKLRLKERQRYENATAKADLEGRVAYAIANAEKMLAAERAVLGEAHDDTVGSLLWLVELYAEQGDFAKARAIGDEAVALHAKLHGDKNWQTLTTRFRRADVNRIEKLDEAGRRRCFEARRQLRRARELYNQNKYAEAIELAEKSLKERQALLGDGHPETARTLYMLASALQRNKDYAKAEARYREAAAVWVKAIGETHSERADSLQRLSEVLRDHGDLPGATAACRQAAAVYEKALGESAERHKNCLRALASLLFRQAQKLEADGKFDDARTARKEVVDLYIRTQGKDHWWVIDARLDLADVDRLAALSAEDRTRLREARSAMDQAWELKKQNKLAEAVAAARKVVETRKALLGAEHPDVAAALNDIGYFLRIQKENTAAVAVYEEAVAIRSKALGEGHPDTGFAYNGLAIALENKGDADGARKNYEKALAIFRKVQGEDGADVGLLESNLGYFFRNQKDHAAAVPHFERAVAIYRKVRGEEHADTVRVIKALDGENAAALTPANQQEKNKELGRVWQEAIKLRDARKWDEAIANGEKALAIQRQLFGHYRVDTATILSFLSEVYLQRNDFEQARTARRQMLAAYRQLFPAGHYKIGDAGRALADVDQLDAFAPKERTAFVEAIAQSAKSAKLRKDGHADEALSLVRKALETLRKLAGEDNTWTIQASLNEALALGAKGDHAAARTLVEKVLARNRKLKGENHPDNGYILLALAAELQAARDPAARQQFEQAVAFFKKTLGETDAATVDAEKTLSKYIGSLLSKEERAKRLAGRNRGQWDFGYLLNQKKYADVLAKAEHDLAIEREVLGPLHDDVAVSLSWIGASQEKLGNYPAAVAARREQWTIYRKLYGDGDWWTIDARDELRRLEKMSRLDAKQRERVAEADGLVQQADKFYLAGKSAEALEPAKQALAIHREFFGDQARASITDLNLIGDIHNGLKDKASAEKAHREAQELARKLVGENHPFFAGRLEFLGRFLRYSSRVAEALPVLRRAVAIRTAAEGKDQRTTEDARRLLMDALQTQALAAQNQDDLDTADKAIREVLSVQKTKNNPSDWEMKQTQKHLDYLAFLRGLTADQRRSLREAAVEAQKTLTLKGQRKYPEALDAARAALDKRRGILPVDDEDFLNSLHDLAWAQFYTAKYDEAMATYRELLNIRKKGKDSYLYRSALNELVGMLAGKAAEAVDRADFDAARKFRQCALDAHKEYDGEDHWKTRQAKCDLDDVKLLEGFTDDQRKLLAGTGPLLVTARESIKSRSFTKYAEEKAAYYRPALTSAQQALDVRRRLLGPDHMLTAEAQHVVGAVLRTEEDNKAAEEMLRFAFATRRKLFGPDHPATIESFDLLSAAVATQQAVSPALSRLTPAQVARLKQRDQFESQMRSVKSLNDSIAIAQKMLAVEREVRGNDHPETIASLELLADYSARNGDYNAARRYADEVVATKTKLHGKDDFRTVEARFQVRMIETLRRLSPNQQDQFWDAWFARWDVRKNLPAGPRDFAPPEVRVQDKRLPILITTATRVQNTLKQVLGADHLYYANALYGLAELHEQKGELDRDAPLYLQAAEITGKALGTRNPAYVSRMQQAAFSYGALAMQRENAGSADAARRAWQKEIDVLIGAFGEKNEHVAPTRLRMALSERVAKLDPEQRKLLYLDSRMIPMYSDFPEQLPPQFGNEPQKKPPVRIDKNLQVAQDILALRRRVLGENTLETADAWSRLGQLIKRKGDNRGAAEAFGKALAIRKSLVGDKHRLVAESLNDLGLLHYTMGDHVRAEPLLSQARAILKEVDPLGAPYLALLNNLAVLHLALNDLDKAEELLREAQGIVRRRTAEGRTPDDDKPQLGRRYDALLAQFNLATALSGWNQEAGVKVEPGVLPEEAATLNNLATICIKRRDFGRGRLLLQDALGITLVVSRTLPKYDPDDDPSFGIGLNNLATLEKEMGNLDQAELLANRSVVIAGHDRDRNLPLALNNLAEIYFERGDLVHAQQRWNEALAFQIGQFGVNHPNAIPGYSNLAVVGEMRGDTKEAKALLLKALAASRRNLELAFAIQSERQQVLRMQALRGFVDHYLSLAERASFPDGETYQTVLDWKGSVFVEQQKQRALAADNPEVAALLRELEVVTRQLGRLAFSDPEAIVYGGFISQDVQAATRRKEEIERQLAKLSAEFRARKERQSLSAEKLRTTLPEGSALVDVIEYSRYTPPKKGEKKGTLEQRMRAFILRPDRDGVTAVDLGPAKPITETAERWRIALEKRRDYGPDGAELRRLVWDKVKPHLKGVRAVYLSPDGALARIPFAALPGEKPDTFLIEEIALAVVPVPQDLPRVLALGKRTTAPSMLLVGDVEFGDGKAGSFRPLPATAKEIEALGDLFKKTFPMASEKRLRGADATGKHFRESAQAATDLHLATHGFFKPAKERSALAPSAEDPTPLSGPSPGGSRATSAHPGSLSGIALAGANNPDDKSGDAILTAYEVGGMDLHRAELVVLSACQTGLGDVAGGEGVLGLQRAFHLAGARTTVASLWRVDDAATAVLMGRFYDNIWSKKLGPAEALRQAQLAVLHREGGGPLRGFEIIEEKPQASKAPHPALWAAWVLSGDPGALPKPETPPEKNTPPAPSSTSPAPEASSQQEAPAKTAAIEEPVAAAPEPRDSPAASSPSTSLLWPLVGTGLTVGSVAALGFRRLAHKRNRAAV